MLDHYETLGVSKEATLAELKAAWRRAASAAHPDREGGSTERMAAVNAAYDALVDPVKRLRYDTTGEEHFKADEMARNTVASLFAKHLEAESTTDIVANARDEVNGILRTIAKRINDAQRRIVKMKGHRPRIKVKKGETNLASIVIDRIIASTQAELAILEQDQGAAQAALALLKKYEYDVERVQRPTPARWSAVTTTDVNRANAKFWVNRP